MRFRRWHRPEPYRDTSRKRAAFLRKQRLEREALPLFADQIGGHLYLDVMRHFVGLFREPGHVTANAAITEINGPIGHMRRDRALAAGRKDRRGRPT